MKERPRCRSLLGLLYNRDGTITIFASISLSGLIVFFACITDYARIMLLHQLTEQTAEAGVRSVLSAYDRELQASYGLFGRGGTEGSLILEQVATEQLSGKWNLLSQPVFNVVQPHVEQTSVFPSAMLGEHSVLGRQLLEEMKYKAPIEFTLDVLEKIGPLSKVLKQSAHVAKTLEKAGKLYEQREKLLEQVLMLQRKAAQKLGSNSQYSYARYAIDGYEQFGAMLQMDRELVAAGELPAYQQSIAEYRELVRTARQELDNTSSITTEHNQLLAQALSLLDQARQVNDQLAELVSENEVEPDASAVSDNGLEAGLSGIPSAVSGTVLGNSYFIKYKSEIDLQEARAGEVSGAASSLGILLSGSLYNAIEGRTEQLMNRHSLLEERHTRYAQSYVSPGEVLSAREQSRQKEVVVRRESEAREKEADASWGQAKELLKILGSLQPTDEQRAVYERVEHLYKQSISYNKQLNHLAAQGEEEDRKIENAAKAKEQAVKAGDWVDGLVDSLSAAMLDARDNWYYGEYGMSRFASTDPRKLKMLVAGGQEEESASLMAFENQELEYMLYGFHHPGANLAAAYGEIFAMRLAIRFMEGLVECRALGHPLAILSGAALYGMQQALSDLLAMLDKGTAPLSKYIAIDWGYKDYLRLFLLMHGGSEQVRLARISAVVGAKHELDLTSVPSAISVEVSASTRLWFLTGAMKLLGVKDWLNGRVYENRYEVTWTVGGSY